MVIYSSDSELALSKDCSDTDERPGFLSKEWTTDNLNRIKQLTIVFCDSARVVAM